VNRPSSGTRAAGTLGVQEPGDHLFACAGLAKNKHLGVSPRSGGDVVAKRDNSSAFSNQGGGVSPCQSLNGM